MQKIRVVSGIDVIHRRDWNFIGETLGEKAVCFLLKNQYASLSQNLRRDLSLDRGRFFCKKKKRDLCEIWINYR